MSGSSADDIPVSIAELQIRVQRQEREIELLKAQTAGLEKALIDQSGIITTLSHRAIESDGNLQRLIEAVEKLCERTEVRGAAPARAQSRFELPFEKQLNEAAVRQPDSGFRPRIVKEEDEELKPRHRMTRL